MTSVRTVFNVHVFLSYWDSSALLKLYVREPDSAIYRDLAATPRIITTALLSRFEIRTTLRRMEALGILAQGEAERIFLKFIGDVEDAGAFLELPYDEVHAAFRDVLDQCFSQEPPIHIRTNDALHLATAVLTEGIDFVSADHRQRTAATLLGLRVHP